MSENTFGSLSTGKRRGAVLSQMRLWALALLLVVGLVGSTSPAHAQQGGFVINSVQFANLNSRHTTGLVSGTLAGLPFTTPISFVLQPRNNPATPAVECAVLNLKLDDIHLRLLGLHVDTSDICLTINAVPGGGLLGDLLCSLASGSVLNLAQLTSLQSLLQQLIQEALNNIVTPGGGGGHGHGQGQGGNVCTGQCEILFLQLGPVDLTLLGLVVNLDNCNNGPVQVCISATAAEGLLGNLLCSLAGPQLLNLSLADIAQLVQTTLQLLPGGLTEAEIAQLTALLASLISI